MRTALALASTARILRDRLLPWAWGLLTVLACTVALQTGAGAASGDALPLDDDVIEQLASTSPASCDAGFDVDPDTMDRDGVSVMSPRFPLAPPRACAHEVRALRLQFQAPPPQRPPPRARLTCPFPVDRPSFQDGTPDLFVPPRRGPSALLPCP